MSTAQTVLEFLVIILGWILLLAVGLSGIGWGISLITDAVQRVMSARYEDGKRAACQHVANMLLGDSWWFSEDIATMNLLNTIAMDINKHGWSSGRIMNVDDVREDWRKARKQQVTGL